MHIQTTTKLSPDQVHGKLATSAVDLVYNEERSPPKLYTSGFPLTFPATAEVSVKSEGDQGSHVVLRLMWGPFPAPLPRVVTAVGVLTGLVIFGLAPRSPVNIGTGIAVVLTSALLLGLQRSGEQRLRNRLADLFGGCRWQAKPH